MYQHASSPERGGHSARFGSAFATDLTTTRAVFLTTAAVEFVLVGLDDKAKPLGDAVLELFDQRLFELLNRTAVETNDVVVMRLVVRQFVAGEAVPESGLFDDTALG
jgi:hypothetical protein